MDAFAAQSGMSKSYISILEKNQHPKTGKPVIPSITVIRQAADGMHVDFNDLIAQIDGDVRILPDSPAADPLQPLSQEEEALVRKYRVSSDDTKAAACAVLGVKRQDAELSRFEDDAC
jgi:transcriptional regulator with XRE-family HTH domain